MVRPFVGWPTGLWILRLKMNLNDVKIVDLLAKVPLPGDVIRHNRKTLVLNLGGLRELLAYYNPNTLK